VVLEAGTQSPWLQRLLRQLGHEAMVVNPHRVRLIAESLQKDDRRDAVLLADLGRMAPLSLQTVEHRTAQEQADIAIVRTRALFVKQRTMLIAHVRATVKSNGGRLEGCTVERFSKQATGQLPEGLREALSGALEQIAHLTTLIRQYDWKVVRLIQARYPETELLRQVPGVGPITALTYRLTVGDPGRFGKSRQVGAYFGLAPGRRQSGKHDPELRISKAGDKAMRALLVQCAQHILSRPGADGALRQWGLKKAEGGKRAHQRAVVAVARKLAVLLHHLWVTGAAYERFPGKEAV